VVHRTIRQLGTLPVDGMISDFPVLPGTRLFDIVTGKDGALGFRVDGALGQSTTTGGTEMFPIPGATRLIGIPRRPTEPRQRRLTRALTPKRRMLER
jgi:hypothetical protein